MYSVRSRVKQREEYYETCSGVNKGICRIPFLHIIRLFISFEHFPASITDACVTDAFSHKSLKLDYNYFK